MSICIEKRYQISSISCSLLYASEDFLKNCFVAIEHNHREAEVIVYEK